MPQCFLGDVVSWRRLSPKGHSPPKTNNTPAPAPCQATPPGLPPLGRHVSLLATQVWVLLQPQGSSWPGSRPGSCLIAREFGAGETSHRRARFPPGLRRAGLRHLPGHPGSGSTVALRWSPGQPLSTVAGCWGRALEREGESWAVLQRPGHGGGGPGSRGGAAP